MRRRTILRLFCALASVALGQPAGTGKIAGTVIDAANGDPVRKVIVTLTWHGTPRSWATTRSDGSGQFQFTGLPAGNYDLHANKAGAGTAIYGAAGTRETGKIIELAEGETILGLKLRFIHSATVSGRVVDSDGDPIAGTQVSLRRYSRNFGQRVLVNAGPVSTADDRGEYRISNVQPGQYLLFAGHSQFSMGRPIVGGRGTSQPDQAPNLLISQFYGGASDPKDAAVLTIKDGDVLSGMDFTLISQPAVRIHGHINGVLQSVKPSNVVIEGQNIASDSPLNSGISVWISPVSDANFGWGQGGNAAGPDYAFDLGWFAPGKYRVQTTLGVDGKAYAASQEVDTSGGSGDVVLTLAPAIDLGGRIRFEGQSSEKNGFNITLNHPGPSRGGMPQDHPNVRSGPDGRFAFKQVTPGEWDLDVLQIPRGEYLKSVRYGDDDVLFKTMEVKPGSDASIDIVISSHTAQIHGEVDAAAGLDPARAAVVLAPVGRFHDLARYYYGVLAGDDGKFKMPGIAPGKYKMYAIEKLAVAAFRNPDASDQVIALFPDLVAEIDLDEDAHAEVHPKLIPSERAREILP
ncbi:MAG TPA: carboxypeptidase regulatory-like domain-containing protein [Bryobacteraceae bacterium]|nr:carboxypeptidase regulatory-like domain-containing protein [Bryobacteraceae bacterium]